MRRDRAPESRPLPRHGRTQAEAKAGAMPHGPGCRPTTAEAVPGGGWCTGRPPAWLPSADGSACVSAAAGDALHTQAQYGFVLVLFLCAVL